MQDKHCFELYGYDVMVDADLTPWLIEVRIPCFASARNKLYDPRTRLLTLACACCGGRSPYFLAPRFATSILICPVIQRLRGI